MTEIALRRSTLDFRPTLRATDDLIQNLLENRHDWQDAQFLFKLQELRREHKKTLKVVENLYKDELLASKLRRSRSVDSKLYENRIWTQETMPEDVSNTNNQQDDEEYLDQCELESMAGSFISDSYLPQDWEGQTAAGSDRSIDERRSEELGHLGDNWRNKPTTPRPFRMTIRDEEAPIKATYADRFLTSMLLQEQQADSAQRNRKPFRARRPPNATYLPLYEELTRKHQQRRQFLKEHAKNYLHNKLKPFNFQQVGHDRHRRRCASLDELRLDTAAENRAFKAKPMPKEMFELPAEMARREREFQRKDEQRKRAENLLKSSKMPPNMRVSSAKRHPTCMEQFTFAPQITRTVPDFQTLHYEFDKEIREAKFRRSRTTVPQPFDLSVNTKKSSDKISTYEMHKDGIKRHHAAVTRSKSLSNLKFALDEHSKPRQNLSAILRDAATKKKLEERKEELRRATEQWRDKEAKNGKIKLEIKSTLLDFDLHQETKERERAEKRRNASQSNKVQFEQYKQAIADKMADRQSLLQQQSSLIAQHLVQKRYKSALVAAGLPGTEVLDAISSIKTLIDRDQDLASAVYGEYQHDPDHEEDDQQVSDDVSEGSDDDDDQTTDSSKEFSSNSAESPKSTTMISSPPIISGRRNTFTKTDDSLSTGRLGSAQPDANSDSVFD